MESWSKYWLNDGTFKFLTHHDSIPRPFLVPKCTKMALATELLRILRKFILQTIQEFKSQSIRTFWWSHKVNIGWMMVLLSFSFLIIQFLCLGGFQIYRYVSIYWSIHIYLIIHCAAFLGIYIYQYNWTVLWSQKVNPIITYQYSIPIPW